MSGALAHGIGTSEVEHVLATQTLIQKKAKLVRVDGACRRASLLLAIIGDNAVRVHRLTQSIDSDAGEGFARCRWRAA